MGGNAIAPPREFVGVIRRFNGPHSSLTRRSRQIVLFTSAFPLTRIHASVSFQLILLGGAIPVGTFSSRHPHEVRGILREVGFRGVPPQTSGSGQNHFCVSRTSGEIGIRFVALVVLSTLHGSLPCRAWASELRKVDATSVGSGANE